MPCPFLLGLRLHLGPLLRFVDIGGWSNPRRLPGIMIDVVRASEVVLPAFPSGR